MLRYGVPSGQTEGLFELFESKCLPLRFAPQRGTGQEDLGDDSQPAFGANEEALEVRAGGRPRRWRNGEDAPIPEHSLQADNPVLDEPESRTRLARRRRGKPSSDGRDSHRLRIVAEG